MEVLFYHNGGDNPVMNSINSLERKDKIKILTKLELIEEKGLDVPLDLKQIKGVKKLWEIKIRLQAGGYRIFYFMPEGDKIMLLHAFVRKHKKLL